MTSRSRCSGFLTVIVFIFLPPSYPPPCPPPLPPGPEGPRPRDGATESPPPSAPRCRASRSCDLPCDLERGQVGAAPATLPVQVLRLLNWRQRPLLPLECLHGLTQAQESSLQGARRGGFWFAIHFTLQLSPARDGQSRDRAGIAAPRGRGGKLWLVL